MRATDVNMVLRGLQRLIGKCLTADAGASRSLCHEKPKVWEALLVSANFRYSGVYSCMILSAACSRHHRKPSAGKGEVVPPFFGSR